MGGTGTNLLYGELIYLIAIAGVETVSGCPFPPGSLRHHPTLAKKRTEISQNTFGRDLVTKRTDNSYEEYNAICTKFSIFHHW